MQAGKRQRDQVWTHIRARFFAGFMAVYLVILSYAAWVVQQPTGKFTSMGHAKRVAPAFIAPGLAYVLYTVGDKLRALMDRRADKQIGRLETKLRRMVGELKDSTRYQRTQALLQKYDPDQPPPSPAPQHGRLVGPNSPSKLMTPRGRAAAAAATAVTGAGAALSSALGQVFGHLADKLIADDPMLINTLQEVQGKVVQLEERNKWLEIENSQLRAEKGLPPRALFSPREAGLNIVDGAAGNSSGAAGGAETTNNTNKASGSTEGALLAPQEGNSSGEGFAFGSPVSLTPERDPDLIPDTIVDRDNAPPKTANVDVKSSPPPVPPLNLNHQLGDALPPARRSTRRRSD